MNAESPADRPNLYAPPQAEVSDVETFEEHEPAERGVRLGAAILDTLILFLAVGLPLLIAVGFSFTRLIDPSLYLGPLVLFAVVPALALIGITIYFVHRNGQTIAKRMLGIKVVRTDGSPASLARIFWLRNVVNALPGMVPFIGNFYSLVDSLFIFGEKRKCVHDHIADTIVVKA